MKSRVRPTLARAHRLDQAAQPGQEAIVPDAQKRSARHVANAGGLDHDRARHSSREALVPFDDFLGDVTLSVARHGTMAGSHVRCASAIRPTSIGENKREARASAADGTRPAEGLNRTRCGGRHTTLLHGIHHALTVVLYMVRRCLAHLNLRVPDNLNMERSR